MTNLPDQIFQAGMDGDECPAGRITTSDISYGDGETIPDVDVTRFENLWGRVDADNPPILWPGVPGSAPTILDFSRTGYVAAAFDTPAELSPLLFGIFMNSSYGSGPTLDFSIGSCGDFSSALGACFTANVAATDIPLMHWQTQSETQFWCLVEPNTPNYVNVRLSNPNDGSLACSTDDCAVTIISAFSSN